MNDINIAQVQSLSVNDPQSVKIEKLDFRWKIVIGDTMEFTVESLDQLPDWMNEILREDELIVLAEELYAAGHSAWLIEDEKDEEAELLSAEMGVSLKQMMAGELASPKPEPEDDPTQVLSLFGGGGIGGGGGGRQPKTEEEIE